MSWRIWPWVITVWSHYFPCSWIRIRKQAQLWAALMQNSLLECICVCEWISLTGAHWGSRLREDVLSEALQRGPDNLNWGPHVYWVIETEQYGYEFSVPVNQLAQGMESLTACGLTNVIPKITKSTAYKQHAVHFFPIKQPAFFYYSVWLHYHPTNILQWFKGSFT